MADKYIDVTPSWLEMTNVIEALLTDGDFEGKQTARAELRKMAQVADQYVRLQKMSQEKVAEQSRDVGDYE